MSAENLVESRPPRRRTQAERRAVTRAKIVTGALDALARLGYTQMRIGDVAENVGISTGALSYHFPQKTDLALAAVEEGERIVLARLRQLVKEASDAPDRDARILDALYEVHSGIEFQAFLSVQAHARSHPELAPGMNRIIVRATKEMGDIAGTAWGPEIAGSRRFRAFIALTLGTVRGLIVIASVAAADDDHEDSWPAGRDVWPEGRSLLLTRLSEIRDDGTSADPNA
jgi:AcrR family transcriptional regulator